MRAWRKYWKKFANLFDFKRGKRFEDTKAERERKQMLHRTRSENIQNLLREKGISLTVAQKGFLKSLHPNLLHRIYLEIHGVGKKKYMQWALEACIEYYSRARKGEITREPIRLEYGGTDPLYAYVTEYIREKRTLEKLGEND